ncbi:alkaline phosphatase family protein [Thermoflexus sp.]|uniref:alkaline phosphatase family protein n=1 Tax=Thermoflexus sp. TaxID=1969742 RepID=UPI002ADD3357|nr:alkaline phosphatase family protein [Thermoflexus sp.]
MGRRGWFAAWLVIGLSVTGWGAVRLALFSWNSVVEYQSPYLSSELPPPLATPPLTDRVVLVVMDGLRQDTATAAMPTLNRLAAQGARYIVRTGEPSLSYPGWTVIGSGAWQGLSGVTTNWFKGPVRVDSIFREAQAAGLRPAGAGTGGWQELFGPWLDRFEVPDVPVATPEEVDRLDEAIRERGLALLRDSPARLVLVYFAGPDEYGHAFGGASPAYQEIVRRTDGRLAWLVAALDLSQTTLVVTTDHGHIDTGGHGGWEPIVKEVPLVMVGKGIRAGVEGRGTQADIAPTIAALLGIPIPVHAMGRPLMEALDGPSNALDAIARASAQQRVQLVRRIERVLGRPPTNFREVRTAADLPAFDQEVTQALDRAYGEQLWQDRLGRTPLALFGLALIALLTTLLFQHPYRGAILGGVLVFISMVWGLYFGRGYQWSLSVFNTEAQIEAFFMARVVDALLGLVAVALLVGIWKGRRWGEAFEGILRAYGGIALVFALQVLLFYWAYGVSFSWGLPDLGWGFKYYLDLLILSAFWVDLPGLPDPVGLPTALILPAVGAALGAGLWVVLRWIRLAS